MVLLLTQILLAHFVGDFMLQPSKWVAHKEKNKLKSKYFYFHLLIHYALILAFTQGYAWLVGLVLTVLHGLVDYGKLRLQNDKNKAWLFLIDQVVHLIIILLAITLWTNGWGIIEDFITPFPYLLLLHIVVVTYVSSIFLKVLLDKWQAQIGEEEKSLDGAGKYIGILERLLVFTFVCLGTWSAVGFLITAKSVLRFGDLSKGKNRKLTEYILIGTLLSFGMAIFLALSYKELARK